MKNSIRKISQLLLDVMNEQVSLEFIRRVSSFVSIICFSLYLNRGNRRLMHVSGIINACEWMPKDLLSDYQYIEGLLSKDVSESILQLVERICENCNYDKNIISWVYQYLKKDIASIAYGKIGKNSNKLEGDDILVTTQFFTDDYMVEFLVDKAFQENYQCIDKVVLVDPACGGGNFLTYAFEKFYKWYTVNTKLDANEIVDTILAKHLVGYDLDVHLAKITALSLYAMAYSKTADVNAHVYVFGGGNDALGYLRHEIQSTRVGSVDYNNCISRAYKNDMHIVYATNPPFMGARDMSKELKSYLRELYPSSKSDLCVAFLLKMLRELREGDMIATVSQNGWLNLSSLKHFREELLEHYCIYDCVDLGSNAFAEINGEKTNIVLCTFGLKCDNRTSNFYNLKGVTLKDKISKIRTSNIIAIPINCDSFRQNSSSEICYELEEGFAHLKDLPEYGSFARCMQGSSTGDNNTFVKYLWERVDAPEDWRPVSKGGGYSKWHGLNYYKVRWGKNAELIKNNPGSAVRNVDQIEYTDFVYSDTGTLGLNVRNLEPKQVFIASGPGIIAHTGKKLCHIGFLNSKIATFLLKARNPKFTISAGYISSLPIPSKILSSATIESLVKRCMEQKATYLSCKLPNSEFRYDNYALINDVKTYVSDCVLKDILNDYNRFRAERDIDTIIIRAYNFSLGTRKQIEARTGRKIVHSRRRVSVSDIDRILSITLNEKCQFQSRKINGFVVGSESVIEYISHELKISPKMVYDTIVNNIEELALTKELYKRDLVHKIILRLLNIDIRCVNNIKVDIDTLNADFKEKYATVYNECAVSKSMIIDIILQHHTRCFMNKPIVTIEGSNIISL